METELIIVRHGETDWNNERRFQGQMDIDLNGKGLKQAEQVSKYLADKEFDKIYASDLRRAYKTAEMIASFHKLNVNKIAGIREINFGEWEGLTYKEIEKKDPVILKQWFRDSTVTCPPGGEMIKEVQDRVVEGFRQLLSESKGQKIVVVSHGGAIRLYLAYLLAVPLKYNWRLEIDNCSLSRVFFYEDGNPVLKLLNSTFYLS